jgi:serine/threonine protein phosphatase PrpC
MIDRRIVEITAFTHQGSVRDHNEDALVVASWLRSAPMIAPERWRFALDRPIVCAIADGMGGQAAGEVASRLAVTRLRDEASRVESADDVATLLTEINAEIFAQMEREPSALRMGTTVVGLVFLPDRLVWFNVGDSRLYRHRNGFLRQISIDDVPALASGRGNAGPRATHEIRQALGGAATFRRVEPHVDTEELAVQSRWLLCSDGLTDMLDLDAMESCMASDDLEGARALFDRAMAAGGHDNVSIVIASVGQEEEPPPNASAADVADPGVVSSTENTTCVEARSAGGAILVTAAVATDFLALLA